MGLFLTGSLFACGFFNTSKEWEIFWDIGYITLGALLLAAGARFVFNIKMLKDETKEDEFKIENAKKLFTGLASVCFAACLVVFAFYHDYKSEYDYQKFFSKHEKEKYLNELFKYDIVPVDFFDIYDFDDGTCEISIAIDELDLKRNDIYDSETDDEDYRPYNFVYFKFSSILRHVASSTNSSVIQSLSYIKEDKTYTYTRKELEHYKVSKNFLKKYPAYPNAFFSNFQKNDINNSVILTDEVLDKTWILNLACSYGFLLYMPVDFLRDELILLSEYGIVNLDKDLITDDYIVELIQNDYFKNSTVLISNGAIVVDYIFNENKNEMFNGILDYNPGSSSIYYTYKFCNEAFGIKSEE